VKNAWNALWSYWADGGIVLVPIGVVSFFIWREFIRARMRMTREMRLAAEVEKALPAALGAGSPGEAAARLGEAQGIVGRVIVSALRDAGAGSKILAALEARESSELADLDRSHIVLGALTVAAPLLGLLGTVIGMIQTFSAVGGSGDLASGVAAGVSSALITTEFGLMVAIPGVFGAAHIRRMAGYIRVRMARCRAILLMELQEART